jgi:hypothetical protein
MWAPTVDEQHSRGKRANQRAEHDERADEDLVHDNISTVELGFIQEPCQGLPEASTVEAAATTLAPGAIIGGAAFSQTLAKAAAAR